MRSRLPYFGSRSARELLAIHFNFQNQETKTVNQKRVNSESEKLL